MVGSQYQAEVPTCLSHYKEGEKGNHFKSTLYMRLASHVLAMSYQEWEYTCPVDNVSASLVCIQLMKMRTSYYGTRVHCQKAKSEVSCRKCRHGQLTKRPGAINLGFTCVTTSG